MGTEATQTEASSSTSVPAVSIFLANPLPESLAAVQEAPFVTPISHFSTQPVAAFPAYKRSEANIKAAQENMMPPSNNGSAAAQLPSPSQGVSNCYIFKSRLQEYAQKKSLPTPVYETIKEGPSHQPFFRSTVIVKDVRYDSLPGFFNRKAAEQSAAEVALTELAKSDEVECISLPVHETGLCKNLLQEYAQKMNYAIPLYECQKIETPTSRARSATFKCTVEVGGIHYIGGPAKTKREAEIKAARTALLAIQSSTSGSSNSGNSQLTVIPFRKRAETAPALDKAANVLKAKKTRFKKKMTKNKFCKYKTKNNNNQSNLDVVLNEATGNGLLPLPVVECLQGERLVPEISCIETTNGVNQNAANASESRSATTEKIAANDSVNGSTIADQNAANASENRSTTVDCNQSIDEVKVWGVTETEVRPATVITGINPLVESMEASAGQT